MTQPVIIAMVEDDEGHARLIEKNLRRAGVHNEIVPLADGASAITFLCSERARYITGAVLTVTGGMDLFTF